MNKEYWKDKKVLVTGSEGMIGKELVLLLKELGAKVYPFDIQHSEMHDITEKSNIESYMEFHSPEYVFHLFGIKGNPKMTSEKPVDFMGPMLQGDTNMILAAQKYGVKKFLYTSSIAVENPESDKFPAWAKETAEKLIEAMRIQYPKGAKYTIVRPANVYGRFDDLSKENLMVVSNILKQGLKDDFVKLYNSGDDVRDIINAKDVARGMIKAMEEMPEKPVNLCSGKGVKVYEIAKEIAKNLGKELVIGSKTKPTKRVMNSPYIKPEISLEDGIKEVVEWKKNLK